jgi:uncharacterized membrane protein YkgB
MRDELAMEQTGTVWARAARAEVVDATAHGLERLGTSVARWGLVVVLAWIGATKFTSEEAHGIHALVEHSPLVAWMYALWSEQATSNVIGVLELVAALGLALRTWVPRAAVVGGLMATATFVVTLSFIASTPGTLDLSHGVPLPGGAAQFLIKDLVLLGASLWATGDALGAHTAGSFSTDRT